MSTQILTPVQQIYGCGPLVIPMRVTIGCIGSDTIDTAGINYHLLYLPADTYISNIALFTKEMTGSANISAGFRTNTLNTGKTDWTFGTELLNAIAIPTTGASYTAPLAIVNTNPVEVSFMLSALPTKLDMEILLHVTYKGQKSPLGATFSYGVPTPLPLP